MSRKNQHLDGAFLENQRVRLEGLRERALAAGENASRENLELQEHRQEPGDIADRGAELTRQDVDTSVQQVEALRLDDIERALEKIEEGTYGLSDESGEPIPRERLEARPEALRTVEEEQEQERDVSAGGRPRPSS